MASYTPNLDLLKKNPLTEGSDTFNITTMLNDNWDKIDSKIGNPAELWVWEKSTLVHPLEESGTPTNLNFTTTGTYTFYRTAKVVGTSVELSDAESVVIGANSNLSQYYYMYGGVPYHLGKRYSQSGTSLVFYGYQLSAGSGYVPGEHVEYLTSPTSTTYPEDGQQGDYWYTRLGQLGDGARIETGSYAGTGTYGVDNPNSLTFGFAPKLVTIFARMSQYANYQPFYDANYYNHIIPMDDLTLSYQQNKSPAISGSDAQYGYAKKSADGKTITWYSTKSSYLQNNDTGTKYYYYAIG